MVTYVHDTTGRFQQRPHYNPEELDRECETIVTGFLKCLYGEIRYPVETEDLKKLIRSSSSAMLSTWTCTATSRPMACRR